MLVIADRIKLFHDLLKKIQAPKKNKPIKEKEEIFYLENQKQPTKGLANYFLDIEVNFFNYILRESHMKIFYYFRQILEIVVYILHIYQLGII